MEIERKFLIKKLPEGLEQLPRHAIAQAYLCTQPVLRVRRMDDAYILTYKGEGLMAREEHEFPLTADAYRHLQSKADGNIISKIRYLIPAADGLTIELDIFSGCFTGLVMAEVEFPDMKTAQAFKAPDWFLTEVTSDNRFQNSNLSSMPEEERLAFLRSLAKSNTPLQATGPDKKNGA